MRVLVVEDRIGGSGVEQALQQAGHDVVRCHEPGSSTVLCAALTEPGGCPLDAAPVDVAVCAHTGPAASGSADTGSLADTEAGLRCAIKRHIPVVVDHEDPRSELLALASATSRSAGDVARAVVAAAEAPLARHGAVATDVFRSVLQRHGGDVGSADASVHARAGNLTVVLTSTSPLEPHLSEVAAVKVVGALRKLDPTAAQISVKTRVEA